MKMGTDPDPQAPPTGTTDVFVSYAREDQPYVRRLVASLGSKDKKVWVDWAEIPPSAEWMAEIRAAIEAADAFVVILTPHSATSRVCAAELDYAVGASKRIVPVLAADVDGHEVPPELAKRNWIAGTDGPEAATDELIRALETDLDHVRAHTRLQVKARDWAAKDEDRSLLVRGRELTEAEGWLAVAGSKEPPLTSLHTRFLLASRKAATRRQRGAISGVTAMFLVAALLGVVAVDQRNVAVGQRAIAEQRAAESRSRELAAFSLMQVTSDPELALLLAIEATEAAQTGTAERALRDAIQSHGLLASAPGPDHLAAIDVSRDGSILIAGGGWQADREIFTISDRLDEAIPLLRPEGNVIADVAIAPSSTTAAAANDWGDLVIYDPHSGEVLSEGWVPWGSGANPGLAFDLDPSLLWVAHEGRVARLDVATLTMVGSPVALPRSHYWSIDISSTGTLALAGESGLFTLDGADGDDLTRIGSGEAESASIDDEGYFVAAVVDGEVGVWDLGSGRKGASLRTDNPVGSVALSPDGSMVAGVSDVGLHIWDRESGLELATWAGVTGWSLVWAPDGSSVYTAGSGRVAQWRVPVTGGDHIADGRFLAVSGGGGVIATFEEGAFVFRSTSDGEQISSLDVDELEASYPSFCGGSFSVPGKVELTHDGSRAIVHRSTLCPASVDVASGSISWILDPSTEADARVLAAQGWPLPDGDTIVSGTLKGGDVLWRLDGSGGAVWSSDAAGYDAADDYEPGYDLGVLSHAGSSILLTRYFLRTFAVVSTTNGTIECEGTTDGRVNEVGPFPGGGAFVATDRGLVIVDEMCRQVAVGELTIGEEGLFDAASSLDGSVIATASEEGVISFWDRASGSPLQTVPSGAYWIGFDPEGRLLGGTDQGVQRYVCETCGSFSELLELARSRVTRELTSEERVIYLDEGPDVEAA